ncbi:MAG: hypothetical protein HY858_02445 [Candidatus Solibacter usitatus]|nr:hypothetical protein [Candidatus Solibacter usitatus]
MSLSVEAVRWQSSEWAESQSVPGVRLRVARLSLAGRAEIARRVRSLLAELEYKAAGESAEDRLEAAVLEARIDQTYVEWGLLEVSGLEIDGAPATVGALVERGPESLAQEAARLVRRQCGLTEDERKN